MRVPWSKPATRHCVYVPRPGFLNTLPPSFLFFFGTAIVFLLTLVSCNLFLDFAIPSQCWNVTLHCAWQKKIIIEDYILAELTTARLHHPQPPWIDLFSFLGIAAGHFCGGFHFKNFAWYARIHLFPISQGDIFTWKKCDKHASCTFNKCTDTAAWERCSDSIDYGPHLQTESWDWK